MEKLIRENREKLAEADVKPVEEAIEKAKSALAGGNLESHAIRDEGTGKRVAQGGRGALSGERSRRGCRSRRPGSAGRNVWRSAGRRRRSCGKKKGEGEVIDAEYVDVDESKKPN